MKFIITARKCMVNHDRMCMVNHDRTCMVNHDRMCMVNHDRMCMVNHDRTCTVGAIKHVAFLNFIKKKHLKNEKIVFFV